MRFFQSLFAAAALVAAAAAVKPEIHNFPTSIEPGKTYEITYSPADSTPTVFRLRQGKTGDLDLVDTLTEKATGGKFPWTVSKDLPNRDDYALEIYQGEETNNNYSGRIKLTGSSASAVSSAASSAAPTSSAASSGKETATLTTASGAVSTSVGSNSTVTTGTLSRTSNPTNAATTSANGPPQPTGAASSLGSPLALILGAFAAIVYFN